jgi:hypothetical protein
MPDAGGTGLVKAAIQAARNNIFRLITDSQSF